MLRAVFVTQYVLTVLQRLTPIRSTTLPFLSDLLVDSSQPLIAFQLLNNETVSIYHRVHCGY